MSSKKNIAVAYYTALGTKNLGAVKEFLHPNIEFSDPQETVIGKEAVFKAAERFSSIFSKITIYAKFGSEDQALIVYDVEIPAISKNLRAASLLSFEDDLISKIELIYDMGSLNKTS
ncbi:MAG: nuclear transport factor 2 family protein [Chlamydiae bacterium]|nr:nuclear transport factor 2 family protein [Chlamydiota bacterium]